MFVLFDSITCTSVRPYNQTRLNQALYNMTLDIQNYDFYIYDEQKYSNEVSGITSYNGDMIYPRQHNPKQINWAISAEKLCYMFPDDDDVKPISSLHFVLSEFLAPRNISADGYIVLVNESTSEVHYYIIRNNYIYRHINRSMIATSFYKGIEDLVMGGNIKDQELQEAIDASFSQTELRPYLDDQDIYGIFGILMQKI
jgi:hypothetical protein